MKKFILFATGVLLFLSAFTASAAAKTPDEILPDTVNIYMKADPSNINEVFSGYYEDMMDSLTYGMFSLNYYFLDEDANAVTDEYTATQENLAEIFATSPLYFAMEANYDIDGYLEPTIITFMFEISESEYEEDILAPYIEDNSTITEVNGISIYEPEDIDGAVTYYEGFFLFADAAESIENLLNTTTPLSENADYIDISEKFLSGNFFEIYIGDIQLLLNEFYGYDDFYETMVGVAAFESIGFSMKEASIGYEFQSYVGQDSEVLAELNLDYDNMDPLSLHELMPNSNPIFYTAKNNSADLISMIKNSYEYDYMAEELAEELYIDLDELVFALENETAFLIQDSGELFPTATLMTKLGDNKEDIQTQVDQFVENAWNTIADESDVGKAGTATFHENDSTVTMRKDTIEINGATLDQFVINIEPNVGKNPYALILAPSLLEFKITIGITSDDVLLISSNKDIENAYGEGLENNSELEDLFSETTDAVTYLSVTQINEYLQTTLTTLEKYLPEDFNELTETKSVINTFLEPWDVLKGTDSITNDYIESEASILANIDKIIANYNLETMEEKFEASSNEDGTELIFSAPRDFSDIEGTEWYGDNVYYLTTKGIVDGHPDGTYKPTDTLNRAEFIKLVIETLDKEEYLETMTAYNPTAYEDVHMYDWYSRHVQTAIEEDLFDSLWENDTNLYPNQEMTRIEAAQILNNVLNKYGISATLQNADEISFIDMSSDNKAVIENVFQNNIMVGTSNVSFAPSKTLNRAEAASIIRNLLNIL